MRRLLFAIVTAAALVLWTGAANAASDWDFSQNWDSGYSDNQVISSTGTPWSGHNGYSGCGAHADNYTRSSSPYSVHLGYYSYGPYSFQTFTLMYTFDSAIPAAGELTFWCYLRYSTLNVQFSADGETWSTTTLYSSRTYVYGTTKKVTVPAGTKYIRWNATSYCRYYYGCWLDNISFVMPEVWVSTLTGFDAEEPNAGTLSLAATAGTIVAGGVTSVAFYYKGSSDSAYTLIGTDTDGSDGWSADWNTGDMVDFAVTVRALAYAGSKESKPFEVEIQVINPLFSGFSPLPDVDGEAISVSASFDQMQLSATFPPNPWSATSYYMYEYNRFVLNVAYSSPFVGTFTKYYTYYNYRRSSSAYHYFKIAKQISGGYQVIASGPRTTTQTGVRTYTLTGSQFQNIPAGSYIGVYNYYGNLRYYSGNTVNSVYTYSNITGAYYNWYSTTIYCAPVRATVEAKVDYPERVEIGYSTDGVHVTPIAQGAPTSGTFSMVWDSWPAIENANVFFAARGFNGNMWGNWHFSEKAVQVVNVTTVNFDTSMGMGRLLFDGVFEDVPFSKTLRVSWENNYTYQVEAPDYQYFDQPDQERWRFDHWSDGGARSHELKVPGEGLAGGSGFTFIAYYTKQYYLQTVSPVPVSGPSDGFYDTGYKVRCTAPQLITSVPFKERYFCNGWEAQGLGLSGNITEAQFDLTAPTKLVWSYRREFSLLIFDDRGVGSGSLPGWYEEGTILNVSVAQHIENGLTRAECRGYTTDGLLPDGSGNSTGDFALTAPVEITWHWVTQHYVTLKADLGSVSPASGWYDEGTVLNIEAFSPGDTDDTHYTFHAWVGEGPGSFSAAYCDPLQQITVNGPITETAYWDIWYRLQVNAVNGSLVSDPSGFYLKDSSVDIEADPPAAGLGERWIAEWRGDSPAVSMERSPDNPHLVTVEMTAPAVQTIEWYKQYLLNVVNTNIAAEVFPLPGYSWHYGGEPVRGYAQYATDHFICSGYRAEGSLSDGTDPFFEFVINEPTTVEWLWTERAAPPSFFWNLPVEVADGASHVSGAELPDGTLAMAFFKKAAHSIYYYTGDGTHWSGTVIAREISGVGSLKLAVSPAGRPVVAYYSTADHALYLLTPVASATGGTGWALSLVDDFGDVGVSADVGFLPGGEIVVAYIDSGHGTVKLATIDAAGATLESLPVEGTAALFCSVAVKPDGEPVVAYYDTAGRRLMCMFRSGADWSVEEVDTGVVGFYCRVRTSPSGEVFVAYQDMSVVNEPKVKFARRGLAGWEIETADTGPAGYNVDFVIGPDATPHILSHDGSNLRYVRKVNGEWTLWRIPKPSGVDGEVSLVLLPQNKPAAFYRAKEKAGYIDGLASTEVNVEESGGDEGPSGEETTGGGGGGGCFVATAAFGSMSVSAVRDLTAFRDGALHASGYTASLVSLYYAVSPAPAAAMGASPAVRAAVRALLLN